MCIASITYGIVIRIAITIEEVLHLGIPSSSHTRISALIETKFDISSTSANNDLVLLSQSHPCTLLAITDTQIHLKLYLERVFFNAQQPRQIRQQQPAPLRPAKEFALCAHKHR